MDFTCAILAGGRSSRMGKDKATMEVCNRPLIQLVYERVRRVFEKVVVVSSRHDLLKGIEAPIVKDLWPIGSSMVGIASALISITTPYVFVLACDMPLITTRSIDHVLSEVHGEDIVIPRTQYGFEALHAVYRQSCLSAMLTRIALNRPKIVDLLPLLTVAAVEEHPAFVNGGVSVFTNLNVEEDLALVERLGGP
jgi:molybdopterin-guanine dinucleotide biosynthesis protein A